ncbi:MAG: hypothetical protein K9G30_02230 [Parvibaculum sp.]|nr:hypothetical protein [Parvibaculum sp.]
MGHVLSGRASDKTGETQRDASGAKSTRYGIHCFSEPRVISTRPRKPAAKMSAGMKSGKWRFQGNIARLPTQLIKCLWHKASLRMEIMENGTRLMF